MRAIWGDGLDDMELQGGCDTGYALLLLIVFLFILLILFIILGFFVWGFLDVILNIPIPKAGVVLSDIFP